MEKQEQRVSEGGHALDFAGENSGQKEDLSFSVLLDRFYLKSYASREEADSSIEAQPFVAGTT